MNLKTVIALAIAAAFAAPVGAQMSPRTDTTGAGAKSEAPAAGATVRGGFDALDRNRDGYISRDEARDATWSSRFSEFDKDNDSRLSRSEYDAMGGATAGSTSGAGSSTTGGMGGSVGPGGTQSGSSTSGIGDKPGQKQ